MQSYTVEKIVDVPVPQIREKTGEMIQLIPQERTSDHVIEQTIDIPSPRIQEGKTDANNQPGVHIQVSKEDCVVATDFNLLCKFHLYGISPAPCGASQIEVAFKIDANEELPVFPTVQVVQKTVHDPRAQSISKVIDIPVVQQRQVSITNEIGRLSQTEADHVVQETEEAVQDAWKSDKNPWRKKHEFEAKEKVQKTIETPQLRC